MTHMWMRRIRNFRKINQNNEEWQDFVKAIWYILALIVVYTILHIVAEKTTLMEAIWQVTQTITTVGYGNQPAATTEGRLITIILGFVFGLALFTNLLDKYLGFKASQRKLKEGGYMLNPHENGSIIINFPGENNCITYIKNRRKDNPKYPICIVDESLDKLPISLENENVHYIKGSLLDIKTYKQANIASARSVLVFPDSESKDCDAKTRTIVENVTDFVDTSKTRVMYLLMNLDNQWLFDKLPASPILEDNEIHLMVQECLDPYSSQAIQKLIRNNEGAVPISVSAKSLAGKTWKQFGSAFIKTSHDLNVLSDPMALVQNGEPSLLPYPDTVINKSDLILLVVKDNFVWSEFEPHIVKAINES